MSIAEILASIDRDIAQLQQARALLGGGAAVKPKKAAGGAKKKAGRPKKSVAAAKPAQKKKRNLSPEGRKRIADAVKKRWANQKAAAKK